MTSTKTRSRVATALAATFVLSGGAAFFLACGTSAENSQFDAGAVTDEAGASSSGASSGFLDNGEGGIMSAEASAAALCGNGVKNPETEICDDGNIKSGDGCSSTCRVEAGWYCPTPGEPCVAIKCGDGIVAGTEDCDDGNTTAGDGCSPTCTLEDGYKCPTAGAPCVTTTCGDGVKEGTEQCDDGNLDPFDGCDPSCHIEPVCTNGVCTSVCGDGIKFPAEACDDGNTRSGDGCSATCQLEPGYTCTNALQTPPAEQDLYIAYRDMKAHASVGGHPDFYNLTIDKNGDPMFQDPVIDQIAAGLVQNTLDSDGKPVYASSYGSGQLPIIQDATTFAAWYRDTAYSKKYVSKLPLLQQSDGTYMFDSDHFFPLDSAPAADRWPETEADETNTQRDFLFTSELHIPFQYKGGEVLNFKGDDDVWVFVNGQLVVDLGGVKNTRSASVTLSDTTAGGLVKGDMYEFVVFQAERNPTLSTYQMSITYFDHYLTSCVSVCGDGIKTPDEVCDDGTANNTGGYGKCNADCTRGPFCGDGIVQADQGEQCDSTPGCSADCRTAANTPH